MNSAINDRSKISVARKSQKDDFRKAMQEERKTITAKKSKRSASAVMLKSHSSILKKPAGQLEGKVSKAKPRKVGASVTAAKRSISRGRVVSVSIARQQKLASSKKNMKEEKSVVELKARNRSQGTNRSKSPSVPKKRQRQAPADKRSRDTIRVDSTKLKGSLVDTASIYGAGPSAHHAAHSGERRSKSGARQSAKGSKQTSQEPRPPRTPGQGN